MPVIDSKRELVLNVILTVITAGFFGLYWLYEMLGDLEAKGGKGQMDKGVHVLLCLVPIVGWFLVAKTMSQQWDVIRQRSEREAEDWETTFIILGVLCPAALLTLNVTLSDNFGDGPEPIDPVKAALDAKDPNAQNAQLVQMLQKQQEQMEEMQAKMQRANYQQNQMLKQQNAQMQAQMNVMKKQVEEQKAAQEAAQKRKASSDAAAQARMEQIQAEIAAKRKAQEAKLEQVEEVESLSAAPTAFIPDGFAAPSESAKLFGGADNSSANPNLFGAPSSNLFGGNAATSPTADTTATSIPTAPIPAIPKPAETATVAEAPVFNQSAGNLNTGLFGAPVAPVGNMETADDIEEVGSSGASPDADLFG